MFVCGHVHVTKHKSFYNFDLIVTIKFYRIHILNCKKVLILRLEVLEMKNKTKQKIIFSINVKPNLQFQKKLHDVDVV